MLCCDSPPPRVLSASIGTSLTTGTFSQGGTLFTSCCVNPAGSFQGKAWAWRGHGVSLWSLDFQSVPPELAGPGEGPAPTRLTEAGPPLSISWELLAGGSALPQDGGRAEPLLVPERQHRSLRRQDAGSPCWVEQMLPEGSPPRDARDKPRPGFWVSLGSSVGIHPPRAPRKPLG